MGLFGGDNSTKGVPSGLKQRYLEVGAISWTTMYHKEGLPIPELIQCHIFLCRDKIVIDSKAGMTFVVQLNRVLNMFCENMMFYWTNGVNPGHSNRDCQIDILYRDKKSGENAYIIFQRGDWQKYQAEFMEKYWELVGGQRILDTIEI